MFNTLGERGDYLQPAVLIGPLGLGDLGGCCLPDAGVDLFPDEVDSSGIVDAGAVGEGDELRDEVCKVGVIVLLREEGELLFGVSGDVEVSVRRVEGLEELRAGLPLLLSGVSAVV